MDFGLTDKVAVVTGSSRGLGLASARALVAEGCRVVLCARGAETLAEAALEVEAAARRPNMIAAVQADASTPDRICSGRPMPNGRRRSTRHCFRRSARRVWSCRT